MSVKMFSRIIGKGHPVIILHGLYGMSDNWLTIAKPLSQNFEVHLPDWRNHGQSPHLPSHTYTDLVNDLKYYSEKNRLERFAIIGHSMGGKAAMRFSLEYPEYVSALIVVDIAPVDYNRRLDSASIFQHKQIVDAMLSLDLNTLPGRNEAEQQMVEKIGDIRVVRFLLKNLVRDGDGFRWRLNLPVLRSYIEEIGSGIDPLSVNPATSYPVLFIAGKNSSYISNNDMPTIRRLFPFAKLISIADASHWVHADKPEEFLSVVKNFLD